ncbi:MAG: hypothetical protein ACI4I6_09615 [Hominimerdicola sp.]
MEKVFYITKGNNEFGMQNLPSCDRFRQIEKLNRLISLGWSIKEMKTEGSDTFFILEKK